MACAEARCITSSRSTGLGRTFVVIVSMSCVIVILISALGINEQVNPNPGVMSDGFGRTRGDDLLTDHFNLSFEGRIDNMVSDVGDTLEEVYGHATKFLDFVPSERTKVNVSTDPDILPPHTLDLGYFGYVVGSDMSVPDAPEMFLGLPPEWSTQSNDNHLDMRVWTAAHEYVHVIRDYQTRDYNGSLYPPWLIEGLPTYVAFQHLSAGDEYVRYWIRELIDSDELRNIAALFQYDLYAIGEGYTVIKYVIDEYGRDMFLDFLDAFNEWDGTKTSDDNLESIFCSVFGKSLQDFNLEWKSYLSSEFAVGFDSDAIERLPGEPVLGSSGWNMPTSARNGRLLIVTDRLGSLDIAISREDGSLETWITTDGEYDGDAKLDSHAEQVAFTSTRNGNYDLFIAQTGLGGIVQLTDDEFVNIMGSWSADNQEIAFTTNRNGDWDIFLIGNDGSNLRELVATEANEGSPAFSPDGSAIVFVSDAGGNRDIFLADSDGSNIQQLTSTSDYESFPYWSPDGKSIVYTSSMGFSRKLCLMEVSSGEVKTLFDHPSRAGFVGPEIGVLRFPVWSSESDTIFVAYGGQVFGLDVGAEDRLDIWWVYPLVLVIAVAVIVFVIVIYGRRRRNT
jgi:hypothetical protein